MHQKIDRLVMLEMHHLRGSGWRWWECTNSEAQMVMVGVHNSEAKLGSSICYCVPFGLFRVLSMQFEHRSSSDSANSL